MFNLLYITRVATDPPCEAKNYLCTYPVGVPTRPLHVKELPLRYNNTFSLLIWLIYGWLNYKMSTKKYILQLILIIFFATIDISGVKTLFLTKNFVILGSKYAKKLTSEKNFPPVSNTETLLFKSWFWYLWIIYRVAALRVKVQSWLII